jgi:hypothetical protein
VGSGLILLVIVAAWLAVLVPMALRTHESSASSASVDRFSNAMRVLSRRDTAARVRARLEVDDPLSAAAYAQGQDDDTDDDTDEDDDEQKAPSRWRERLAAGRSRTVALPGRVRSRWSARRRSTPAVRRRRLLATLVLLATASLAGGIVGPRWLLVVAAGLLVVVALFVVQLRRLALQRDAVRRQDRQAAAPGRRRPVPATGTAPVRSARVPAAAVPVAPAAARVPAAEPAGAGSVRVQPASVPAPARAEPLPAAAADDTAVTARQTIPAQDTHTHTHTHTSTRTSGHVPTGTVPAAPAAAIGEAWSPVPVPVPTYVTAPVAPARAARIVDLTRPGAWTQPEAARPLEELPGTAPVPERVPERRRAVNEW